MGRVSMIREPEIEHRERGLRRWSVVWALFDHGSLKSTTRRRLFFTERGAERWLDSKRIKPSDEWRTPAAEDGA